jgi:hypothetical protein
MVFQESMERIIEKISPSNKIIQGLWIGKELSNIEQLCIKSFLKNGHEFHLYTYNEIENIPIGTILKNGSDILPEKEIFTIKEGWGKGSYSAFADIFRYALLSQKGGWWVDMDVICLRPFELSQDLVICSSYEYEWGEQANNCILKAPAGHELLHFMLEICHSKEKSEIKFGELSPHLIQKAVKELKLSDFIVPFFYFNPISWKMVDDCIAYKKIGLKKRVKEILRPVLKPESMKGRTINKESFSVHLWNEIWRQNGLNKNGKYHKSSMFETLKLQYGI